MSSKNQLLVSAIITTKNEEKNIGNCLKSIFEQTYKYIEIIVVDNNSSDKTQEIVTSSKIQHPESKIYLYNKGPERSAQRNFGAQKAKSKYVLFLDADMILTPKVIEECIKTAESYKVNEGKPPKLKDLTSNIQLFGGIIIPEKSFGEGFWAQCKALERSFYVGNDAIEAARFYTKDVFKKAGGFDESITGPEDWDFSQRVRLAYKLDRISSFILHNEGKLSLTKTMKKKYYYAKNFSVYMRKNINKSVLGQQISPLQRYFFFFSRPAVLFESPFLGFGMLFMKTCEFSAGAMGFLLS